MSKTSSPALYIKDKIVSPIKEFIQDSRAVGITLIACTIISLVLSNSPWGEEYIAFWDLEIIHAASPSIHLPHSIMHIINDALMAIFFFLVGLEIKRELLVGELASIKKSALPVIGAVGGMTIPALIFLMWTWGTPESRGWGIPMATDIAFSLGVLSMLGKRAPFALRVFLMALAIIDDLGGIVTIAIFYAEQINWTFLFMAAGLIGVLSLLNIFKVKRYYIYFILGAFLWYFFFNSGVHATIAGVILAFTIPLHKIEDLIHSLHDPVNFIILPLFALANTTIVFPSDLAPIYASIVHWGIFTGLVMGKPIGIFLFSWLAVKFKIAALPKGMNWYQLIGMGMIAGIGFTMSIFMATLAYKHPETQVIAKIGILGASLVAGVMGFLFIFRLCKHVNTPSEDEENENVELPATA